MKPSTHFLTVLRIITTGLAIITLSSCANASEIVTPTSTEVLSPTEPTNPTSTPEPTEERWVLHSTENLPNATIDEVLNELTLLNQAYQAFLSQSGWYHIKLENSISSAPGQRQYDFNVYGWDTTQLDPPIQTREAWLEVSSSEFGLGHSFYSVNSNANGDLIQVVARDAQGNGGNLTLLEQGLADNTVTSPALQSEIGQIIDHLDQIRSYEQRLRAGFITGEKGREYVIDLAVVAQHEPFDLNWLPEPVNGFTLFYRIDAATGVILNFMENDINASKEIFRTYSEYTLAAEFVDLMPQDIQEHYEAAMERYRELLEEVGE